MNLDARICRALVSLRLVEGDVGYDRVSRFSIEQVQEALAFKVHPDLLATFVSKSSTLRELSIQLENIVSLTQELQKQNPDTNMIAIGFCSPCYYCVRRDSAVDRELKIHTYDTQDRSVLVEPFADFLEHTLEFLREYRAKQGAEDAEIQPNQEHIDTFSKCVAELLEDTEQYVNHEKFGVGRVLEELGKGDSRKFHVEFEDKNRKVLLARFLNPLSKP